MNEKVLMISSAINDPYYGYEMARLTIGRTGTSGWDNYGYMRNEKTSFGELVPNTGYSSLCVTFDPNRNMYYVNTIGAQNPSSFFYDGIKYSSGSSEDQAKILFYKFKQKLNQTVDVFIQKSGGGVNIFLFMLATLFGGMRHEPERDDASVRNKCEEVCIRGFRRYQNRPYYRYHWSTGRKNHSLKLGNFPYRGAFFISRRYDGIAQYTHDFKWRCSASEPSSRNSVRLEHNRLIRKKRRSKVFYAFCIETTVFQGGLRQNHRPDYRSCVASDATSLKEVA